MRQFKPTTPSRRGMTVSSRRMLSSEGPEKRLSRGVHRAVGRNSAGRITTRHKGGGHKQLYRLVDFKQNKQDVPARVLTYEYDPNRTSHIALVAYRDGEKRYVLLPQGMMIGAEIVASKTAPLEPGNRLPLGRIPVGTFVYNVEVRPDDGGKLVRSAGIGAEVLAHDAPHVLLRMPSKEVRRFNERCWGSIGRLGAEEHRFVTIGKAGRSRWLGVRPTVRGSAMNPVDHPYGGGEGRALRGTRRPKNKWGKGTRGVRTRRSKKYSNRMIIERRKK
ncbi:MAG: large subunit ribosomal protein L2 [Parcubacteria group bacterium Gr01-1014_70]|nr:MAG: large subunit ribosomal protein L2 [Parcubacteria group bacterium Gr01-1014_70]